MWCMGFSWGSGLVALWHVASVKHLPAVQEMQEMRAQFLDREDALEEEGATHSSILTWKIPWTERPGRL